MRKPEMPEWTKGLPDHTKLTSLDVMKMFGYKVDKAMGTCGLDKKGYLPPCDIKIIRNGKRAKKYWTLGSLRKFVKENKESE